MRAILFALTDLDHGRRLGHAVICAGARYASIQWAGAARLERRHATVTTWRELEAEVALGLPPGPLPSKSVLSRVLSDRSDIVMPYVTFEDLPPGAPALTAEQLDARLATFSSSRGPISDHFSGRA